MTDQRQNASENRSVRLMFGGQRVLVEKNITGSFAIQPYCVKSRNRDFLAGLLRSATLDPDRVFKGSFNHMVFLNKEEAVATLGGLIGMIPLADPVAPTTPVSQNDENDDSFDDDGPI